MTFLLLVGTLALDTGGGLLVHAGVTRTCSSSCSQLYYYSYRDLKYLKKYRSYHKNRILTSHRSGLSSFCNHFYTNKRYTLENFAATQSKYFPKRLLMNDKGLLNIFSRSPSDRLNNHRNQASLLEECEESSQVRYVIFFQRGPLLKLVVEQDLSGNKLSLSGQEQAHIAWFTMEHCLVQQILATGRQALLLGKWTNETQRYNEDSYSSQIYGKYCFVLDATGVWNSDQIAQIEAQPMNIRSLLYKVRFDPQEAAILAHAQSLLEFHSRHQYCGKCGAPTRLEGMGSKRVCSAGCGMEWFPRSDPVIIVAVVKGDYLLMGRQSTWPLGRYSVIAGFMEHGESIEDAIYREVKEETSVQVGRCRYHSSQPWPFPYSLMLGFVAEASITLSFFFSLYCFSAPWSTFKIELRLGPSSSSLLLITIYSTLMHPHVKIVNESLFTFRLICSYCLGLFKTFISVFSVITLRVHTRMSTTFNQSIFLQFLHFTISFDLKVVSPTELNNFSSFICFLLVLYMRHKRLGP